MAVIRQREEKQADADVKAAGGNPDIPLLAFHKRIAARVKKGR